MQTDKSGDLIADFSEEGVSVKIPPQRSLQKLLAKTVPAVPINQLSSKNDEFKPVRFVIHVELVDANDPDTILTDFDPAFELQVKYTPEDLARLEQAKTDYYQRGGKQGDKDEPTFQLGFWDGHRWVLFTKKKHNYRIEPNDPPETGGFEIVDISKWKCAIAHGP